MIGAALHLLRGDFPDGARIFIYIISIAISAYFTNEWRRSLKARVNARDHAFETSEDVLFPGHCVSCGSPHAEETLSVATRFMGGQWARYSYPPSKRTYPFRACGACAAPVLRRRRFGMALTHSGYVLIALALLLMLSMFLFDGALPKSLQLAGFVTFVVSGSSIVPAFGLLIAGQLMNRYSPAVAVIATGDGNIIFRFSNQVYRNHFAALNGEAPLTASSG